MGGARAGEPRILNAAHVGVGRELFGAFRAAVGRAEEGASIFAKSAETAG